MRPRWSLCLLVLLGACAYYNGMYNTKRLAGRARKAEREGRSFEATSLWGQVAVKAESVVIRHPSEKWSNEARLLHGTALVKLNDCSRALRPLEGVMTTARTPELVEEAALLVGACRLREGDADGATAAYARLLDSHAADRRALARYQHGRALRLGGRFEEALAELSTSSHPRARGERAAALAGLGRLADALPLADSLLAERDSLAPWDSLLALVAEHDAEAASALTDRVATAPGLSPALRARLVLEEGRRWSEPDPARSEQRLRQADSLGRDTPVQSEARLEQGRLMVSRAASLPELRQAAFSLEDASDESGRYDAGRVQLGTTAQRVALYADSTSAGVPQGDLRLFLAGELARDSLGAARFAAAQFRRVAKEWPQSPFAPKAMLALIPLDPQAADSLRNALLTYYPENPYVAMAQGGDSPAYEILEDSLRRFAATFRPEGRRPTRPTPARRQPQQPQTPREPADTP
jgi:hypothetical protein